MHGCSRASTWDFICSVHRSLFSSLLGTLHTITCVCVWVEERARERETLDLLLSQSTDAPSWSSHTHTQDTGITALLRSRPVARSWVMRRSPPGSHWTLIRDKDQSLNTPKSWGRHESHHITLRYALRHSGMVVCTGGGVSVVCILHFLLVWQIVTENQSFWRETSYLMAIFCLMKD